MADSFLSQDEIDRLLNADTESPDDLHGSMGDAGIKPYDPNTQRRVIRERLHSLEIINERFARQFRMGLLTCCAAVQILRREISRSSRIMSLPAIYRCQLT